MKYFACRMPPARACMSSRRISSVPVARSSRSVARSFLTKGPSAPAGVAAPGGQELRRRGGYVPGEAGDGDAADVHAALGGGGERRERRRGPGLRRRSPVEAAGAAGLPYARDHLAPYVGRLG